MTARKTWPEHVENYRMDAIAALLNIKSLQDHLETANRYGDRVEVARINYDISKQVEKAHDYLKEAKRA